MKRVHILVITTAAVAAALAGLHVTGNLGAVREIAVHASTAVAFPKKGAGGGATKSFAAPAVTVVPVEMADFVERQEVTGTLVAREEVLVTTEVEGLRITGVLVDEGQRVSKGDVMVRLETATLDAQLAQNVASLSRASAAIAQARSTITSAQAKEVEAANALERAKPLRQSGIMADATYDQRVSAARAAEASLVSARDGLQLAEADKAQIEAQRRDLEWKRGKTDIRAPVDGIVSRRNAKVGAVATAVGGDPMFRIIADGQIELDGEVPEVQLGRFKVGQPATLTISGAGEVSGEVRLVSPEIDRVSRLGHVRIKVAAMAQPRVGAFARASVVVGRSRGLALPASAIQFDPDGASVQAVVGDRVATRKVELGLQAKGLVEVRSGLAAGDVVIARAGTFVRDGDVVRPTRVPAKPGEGN